MLPYKRKVLIVDDHCMLRDAIAIVLNQEEDFTVVGQAATYEDATKAILTTRFDAAIVDLSLGKESGIRLIANIAAIKPSLIIVVVSMHDEVLYGQKALKAGARGYISKNDPPSTLISGLRKALAGGLAISDRLQNHLLQKLHGRTSGEISAMDVTNLTVRELEVLRAIAQGFVKTEIARQLNISINTVESHRTKLKIKLGALDSRALFLRALELFPEFTPPTLLR